MLAGAVLDGRAPRWAGRIYWYARNVRMDKPLPQPVARAYDQNCAAAAGSAEWVQTSAALPFSAWIT
jgi:hypothetical protein